MQAGRQMDAATVDQGIPGRIVAPTRIGGGRAGIGIALGSVLAQALFGEGLEIAQVVGRAVVPVLFTAVVVRRVGNQRSTEQIRFNLQGRHEIAIRRRAQVGVCILVAAGTGVDRPEDGDVVRVAVLEQHAGRDGPGIIDGPFCGKTARQRVRVVRVGSNCRQRRGVDVVDPAAIVAVPEACAHAKDVVDDRRAPGNANFVVGRTVLGHRGFRLHHQAAAMHVRLRHDVPDRAAFRAGTEQRALRTAQHFDVVKIECLGKGVIRIEAQRPHLDRRVVNVDARRA